MVRIKKRRRLPQAPQQFEPDTIVLHAAYGEGVVLSNREGLHPTQERVHFYAKHDMMLVVPIRHLQARSDDGSAAGQ